MIRLLELSFLQAHYVQSYHIQRNNSRADDTNRPKVRLIENPFHFIIQNSIPTSLPHTAKSNSVVKYKHQSNCKYKLFIMHRPHNATDWKFQRNQVNVCRYWFLGRSSDALWDTLYVYRWDETSLDEYCKLKFDKNFDNFENIYPVS